MKKSFYVLGIWIFLTWLITAIHHVYTGYLYDTPWRAKFAYTAIIPTTICIFALLIYYFFPYRILKMIISMQVTIFFFIVIGIWEGAWCHATKLLCYYSNIPFHNAPPSWNIPFAPIPTDIFSEVTGVLNFIFAAITYYHFLRWFRSSTEHATMIHTRKKYKKIISLLHNEKERDSLYHDFDENYTHLYTTRKLFKNKSLTQHQDFVILPGIALYDAYLNHKTITSPALTSMDNFYKKYYHPTKQLYQLIGKLPFFYWFLTATIKKQLQFTYPKCGFEKIWKECNSKKIEFHMIRCFYFDTLNFYHRKELVTCFCSVDDYLYQDLSKKIIWKRHHTIGKGDLLCDFCFEKK